jgi:hypothetical protein
MRPTPVGVAWFGCAVLAGTAVPVEAGAQDTPAATEASPPPSPSKKAPAKRPSKVAGRVKHPGEAGAVVPGFETLADGSTRFFVELSRPVQYEAKATPAIFTCILKGAHVDRRNNYNPLVTVHFNTPVTSARLVPHGADLWLVAALRSKVTPDVTMDATKDGGAMLRVEFPKGDYVRGAPAPPAPDPDATSGDQDSPGDGADTTSSTP